LVLALVLAVITLVVCRLRCRTGPLAFLAAISALAVMVFVRFSAPILLVFTPAGFFSALTFTLNPVIGMYVGGAVQILFGVWLLGWFGQLKTQNHTTGEPAG
jgi:hypothetical protein